MAPRSKNLLSTPVEKLFSKHLSAISLSCFLVMVLADGFLSYLHLSLSVSLWIILGGILIPLAAFTLLPQIPTKPGKMETLPPVPPWIWIALGFTALFLRLFRFSGLFGWPLVDEGTGGYFSIRLAEKWNGQLVYGYAQEPALYIWIQAFLFKIFGVSLESLKFLPTLCSLFLVPAAWLAARRILGRTSGFLACAWMALAFWPLLWGRFSVAGILMVLWEVLVFWALANYLGATEKPAQWRRLLFLGLLTGIGFYIYLAWPIVAIGLGLVLILNPKNPASARVKAFLVYAAVALVITLPLALTIEKDSLGYLQHLWPGGSPANLFVRLLLPLVYAKGLFFGAGRQAFSFGPLSGGLLNPILTALFFIGIAGLLRDFRRPLNFGWLGLFVLFFLPAALTNNFEMMRLAALLPLMMGIGVGGTHFLSAHLPPKRRAFLLGFCFLASLSLDFFHLCVVYPSQDLNHPGFYGAHKTPEFKRAYAFLKPCADAQGPGLILLNFLPDPYDQTLFLSVYAFNAAENPALDPQDAKWAAVVTNIHEQPYLKKLFPLGRWTWLSEGLSRPDGGLILQWVEVSPANRPLLMKWNRADRSLGDLTRLIVDRGEDANQEPMLKILEKAHPCFKGDRLLESRFWRLYMLHQLAAGQLELAVEGEEKAVRQGYPMAHLENELGCLLYKDNRLVESRKAFEQALRLEPNCTDAAANLQNLSLLKKP